MKRLENIVMETIKCDRQQANIICNAICDNQLEYAKREIIYCNTTIESISKILINLISEMYKQDL